MALVRGSWGIEVLCRARLGRSHVRRSSGAWVGRSRIAWPRVRWPRVVWTRVPGGSNYVMPLCLPSRPLRVALGTAEPPRLFPASVVRWLVHSRRARGRPSTGRRPRWSAMMWRLTVDPLLPLRIPGTPVIVPVPVTTNRELHYRDAEAWRIRVERYVPAVIVINDIGRINPPAIVCKRHITPAPIVEATHHLDR